jgi:hypothetical protein
VAYGHLCGVVSHVLWLIKRLRECWLVFWAPAQNNAGLRLSPSEANNACACLLCLLLQAACGPV